MDREKARDGLARDVVRAAPLFAALAIVMTWPLVRQLATGTGALGDPLLNAWILAWDTHKIAGFDLAGFFDANIFHPYPRTLAWSEVLLPQALVAAPIVLLGGNALLAHNVVTLLAIAGSGLGMFALARAACGSRFGAVVAGIAFAFCPFMANHVWHLQVVSAAGIPLTFLFLERLLANLRWRDAAWLAVVFSAQALANAYFALFLGLFVVVFLAIELPRRRLVADALVWQRLVAAGAASAVVVGPVFLQYARMQSETGLVRGPDFAAHWAGFLAVQDSNRLWGPLTAGLGRTEALLFPGLVAALLALWGGVAAWRSRGGPARRRSGFYLPTYLAIGVLALAFSFGGAAYGVLYRFVPGFEGVRAVARFHVFTALVLALLAAFGAAALVRIVPAGRRPWLVLVPVAMLVEYATMPIPLRETFSPATLPAVYRWLADHGTEDDVVLELPVPRKGNRIAPLEGPRVYASTYHWKRLVNGYSGLFSPVYQELQYRWEAWGVWRNLVDARSLGVRYVVVHDRPRAARLFEALDRLEDYVRPAARFDDAAVYELLPAARAPRPPPPLARPLDRAGWVVAASNHSELATAAVDGDPATHWFGDQQRPGLTFEVDLGDAEEVCGLRLGFAASPHAYPRGLRVEASLDGSSWRAIAQESPVVVPIERFVEPRAAMLDVRFTPTTLRHLRLVQTRDDERFFWRLHELDVFARCEP